MEAFKAVEKEMKTKAFSKEGLNASQKLDPRDQEKASTIAFLEEMIDSLGQQLEPKEADMTALQTQMKKSKKDVGKQERLQEVEHTVERHKWHIGRLELLLRAVDNESVDPESVKAADSDLRYYVESNQEVDFMEDDSVYDQFNLDEEEGRFGGVQHDADKVGSEDDSHEDAPLEQVSSQEAVSKQKSKGSISESHIGPHRRSSQQIKSPLPTLATLHTANNVATAPQSNSMKPAPPPSKPPGEPLKYASAAAAAAASDKAGIGIAPLPAPPSSQTAQSSQGSVLAPSAGVRSSATTSPASNSAVPAAQDQRVPTAAAQALERQSVRSPAQSHSSLSATSPAVSSAQVADAAAKEEPPPLPIQDGSAFHNEVGQIPAVSGQDHDRDQLPNDAQPNGIGHHSREEQELIYHLPSNLQELIGSYEAVKEAAPPVTSPEHQRQLAASFAMRPDAFDAERPRHYKPSNPAAFTPNHWPQEPLPIFDDPRLYDKIDTDALFYSFYYRQGTYQQYLAAKALKNQSWRFHKQYQTWFQRHEEPKNITEDFEQGTYRFFDYESTW